MYISGVTENTSDFPLHVIIWTCSVLHILITFKSEDILVSAENGHVS
jgi:hypothetical protein